MPTPNTVVKILKGIELDRDLENTYRFASLSAQQNFFSARAKHILGNKPMTGLRYIRTGEDSIKVELETAALYDCNYLMFQNTGYKDKSGRSRWFYAFIDRVDYVNEETSEIFYTIDPMQTWLFDYRFADCMVEREHVRDDRIGKNVISEPVECGEYMQEVSDNIFPPSSFEYKGGIITTKPINQGALPSDTITIQITSSASLSIKRPIPYAGVDIGGGSIASGTVGQYPTDLSWYADFSLVKNKEATGKYHSNNTVTSPEISGIEYYSLQNLISWIANAKIDGMDAKDIYAVFIYPDYFSSEGDGGVFDEYGAGSKKKIMTFDMSSTAGFKKTDGTFFTPRNNKLYTFPYTRLTVSSHYGNVAHYKFELFGNGFKPKFTLLSVLTATPQAALIPCDYRGKIDSIDDMVTLPYAIEIPVKGDAFKTYIAENKGNIIASLANTVLSAAIPTMATSSTVAMRGGGEVTQTRTIRSLSPKTGRLRNSLQDTTRAVTAPSRQESESSTVSYGGGAKYSGLVSMVGDLVDKVHLPNPVYGNMTTTDILATTKRNTISLYREGVSGDIAKTIDDFFTMFGYAVKEVKQPGMYNRHYWQYIKTCGCVLHNSDGYSDYVNANVNYSTGMNAADMDTLEKIFNRGITFWNQDVQIGDYTLNNGTLEKIYLPDDKPLFKNPPPVGTNLSTCEVAVRAKYTDSTTIEFILPGDRSVSWEVKTGVIDDSYVKTDKVVEGTHEYRVRIADLVSEGKEITSA
jgi:hypothetical protein